MTAQAVRDLVAKYTKGITDKHITPHKLRASAACALAKNNVPVKAIAKQLGHSQIGTTMRYVDVFNEDMENFHGKRLLL